MNRSRVTGNLASHGNIFVDIANDRVGIGSTIPGQKLSLPDSAKIALGNSADLQIYHSGSHSFIDDTGTGNLKLRSNNFRVSNADESKVSATFQAAGAVELYYNNTKMLETNIPSGHNGEVILGQKVHVRHTASGNGQIFPASGNMYLNAKQGETSVILVPDAGVHLYYNNAQKFVTTNTGAVVSGILTATSFAGDGSALTGISAGTSLSGSTNNTVCTVTGANAIQGESNVQIDSNGRLLIGTTTAGESNGDEATFANTGGNAGITIRSAVDSECKIYFSEGTSGGSQYRGAINYNQNTNYMAFSANEYERMRIQADGDVKIADGDLVIGTSGHGIDFSATADGTGSSQVEILDDYEEGSWTPTVGSGNASFSTMIGRYTKIGNQVTLWLRIAGGGSYSGSGALIIQGLPFTNNTPFNPIGTSEYYKILFGNGFSDHCTPYLAGQNLQWLRNGSSGGSGNYLTVDLFYSGAAIQTVLSYMTNS